jgi:hypothetical protein
VSAPRPEAVIKAAAAWLRTKYYFLGRDLPGARPITPMDYIDAETNLIEALTGERDIVDAMRALGGTLSPHDEPGGKFHTNTRRKAPDAPTEQPARPKRKRKRITKREGGLFA